MVVQGEGDLGRRDFFDLFSDWGVKNYRTDNSLVQITTSEMAQLRPKTTR